MPTSSETPRERTRPKPDVYQRRTYAACRALIAVDRASRLVIVGAPADVNRALRWMSLWMAFAFARNN